jgi:hypothetical protein
MAEVSPLDRLCSPHGRIRKDLAPPAMDVDEFLKVWFDAAQSQANAPEAQKIYCEFQFYDYLWQTFVFTPHKESSLQRSYEYTAEQTKLIGEFYVRVRADYLLYFGDGSTQTRAFAGVKR